jgi:hypothetical protein
MFFFTLHMAVQPMVSREANVAQGVLLGCLTTLSAVVGALFFSTSDETSLGTSPSSSLSLLLADVVVALSAFVVPVVVSIVCAVVAVMPPLSRITTSCRTQRVHSATDDDGDRPQAK